MLKQSQIIICQVDQVYGVHVLCKVMCWRCNQLEACDNNMASVAIFNVRTSILSCNQVHWMQCSEWIINYEFGTTE